MSRWNTHAPEISQPDRSRPHAELGQQIDAALREARDFRTLFEQLRQRGIEPIPSLNRIGLNGMSYRFRGERIKGSDVGRAYTARGLAERHGLSYDAARDAEAIREALSREVFRAGTGASNSAASLPGNVAEMPIAEPIRASEKARLDERDRPARRRDRDTGLSPDARELLLEIGRYRMIARGDIISRLYPGNGASALADLNALRAGGLIERTVQMDPKYHTTHDVIVLSKAGKKAAYRLGAGQGIEGDKQYFHAGFVKPQEIAHDSGIFRMGRAEQRLIQAEGGRVTRVVLDFELKRELWKRANEGRRKRADYGPEYQRRKQEIARDMGLQVVDGRVVFPDLRLEYIDREGARQRRDLELASGDYKASQMSAKHRAGLRIYGPDTALGGTPWHERTAVSR